MRFVFTTICLIAAVSAQADESAGNESLPRACEFLWSRQSADGGWHSQQYAVLRSGQALTPFVLHALLTVPESVFPRPQGGVARALAFIRRHVDDEGALGHADPDIVEYPVYSTSYAMLCLIHVGDEADQDLAVRMERFLVRSQFSEANGFDPTMPAYGGWGFDKPLHPGKPGHMDLAHTRRALQALAAARQKLPALADHGAVEAALRAQNFLRVVQRHPDAIAAPPQAEQIDAAMLSPPYDGGFYFSPVILAANKGREATSDAGRPYFRSYATATCDGILALLAAGVPPSDEQFISATHWLVANDKLTYPQGVPAGHPEPWGEALRFYHYAVRAEAYAALDGPGDWHVRLVAELSPQQLPNGSFRNGVSSLMKEDDPLLCTTLAVVALSGSNRAFRPN